jgi:hypothetical protein
MSNQPFGGKRNSFLSGPDHPKFRDLCGRRFARWHVVSFAGTDLRRKALWNCVCDCGVERAVLADSLLRGDSASCGCLSREKARAAGDRTRTHGMTRTTTHTIWMGMIQRCHNPNAKDFYRYGARGITVCDRWRKFENFFADMGERPQGKTLDRIDNSRGYEPENCRWATPAEQTRNSRLVRNVTINGRTQCLIDWTREIGMKLGTVRGRLNRGWPVELALTTPADPQFNWRAK